MPILTGVGEINHNKRGNHYKFNPATTSNRLKSRAICFRNVSFCTRCDIPMPKKAGKNRYPACKVCDGTEYYFKKVWMPIFGNPNKT